MIVEIQRDHYMTIRAVAESLGVSSDTIRRWIRIGALPAAQVVPQAVLLPMNGWDRQGYRLGYGAGFFDRTLASLAKKPIVIGVAYELAQMETIRPQPWDIPVDYLVTERGVYRRDPEGLAYLSEPQAGDDPSALSSPVCYAGEVKRND